MMGNIEARLRFLEQKSDRLIWKANVLHDRVGQFAQDVMMTSNGQQNGRGRNINFLIRLLGCNNLPLENHYVGVGIGFWSSDFIAYHSGFYDELRPFQVGKTDRSGYAGFKLDYPLWTDRDGTAIDISLGNSYHFKQNSSGFWVVDSSQTSNVILRPGYRAILNGDYRSLSAFDESALTFSCYFYTALSPLPEVNTPPSQDFIIDNSPFSSSLVFRSRPRELRLIKIPDGNGGTTRLSYNGNYGLSLRAGLVYSGSTTISGTYAISWVIGPFSRSTTDGNAQDTTLTATISTVTRNAIERPVSYGSETGTGIKQFTATATATDNPIQVKFDFSATGLTALTGLSYVTMEDIGRDLYFENLNKYSYYLNKFTHEPGTYIQINDYNVVTHYINACVTFDPTLEMGNYVSYPSDGSLLHSHSELVYTKSLHTTVYFTVASGYQIYSSQSSIVYWYYFSMDYFNSAPTLTIAAYKFNGYYARTYAGRDQDIVTETASSWVSTGYSQSYEFLFTGQLASDLGVSVVSVIARNYATLTHNALQILMDPVAISDDNESHKASFATLGSLNNETYGLPNAPDVIPDRKFFTSSHLQQCVAYNIAKDQFETVQGYPVYCYDYYGPSALFDGNTFVHRPGLAVRYWTINGLPQCASLNGNTYPSGTILGKQLARSVSKESFFQNPTYNSSTNTDTYAITGDASLVLGITSVSLSCGKRSDYSIISRTFSFETSSQGWAGYPTYNGASGTLWDVSHGSSTGCLSGFASTSHAADVPFSFTYSGTWQDLGVPAGKMVQSIGLNLKENGRGGVVSSTYGPHVLADSNGNTVGTMRMTEQIQPAFPNTWRQVVCSNTLVPDGMQASNSSIKLILNGVAAGGDSSDTYVSFDDVTYTIFYK